MAVEYEIMAKQDIPSDGKPHSVALREIKLPASYIYHSVPKLNPAAFLLARVGDYSQYDLLPGQTNIFFEGMFVGQTYLNPGLTGDSLILSLGRDDRISVKRNQLKDFTSSRVIGPNKKVTRAYEIVLRNTKKTPVTIEVLDQLPISQNKDIVVELEEYEGADYNPDYGKILWRVGMAPDETRRLRFIYSVKYPKDKQIAGF
jgi:uncharacterized protein (TIGR02231 family)